MQQTAWLVTAAIPRIPDFPTVPAPPYIATITVPEGGTLPRMLSVLVHGSDQLPFPYQLRQPGLDAIKWRAELAIRFGVILLSSDTNQILKFLLRFLVPRTKLLRRPVQTQSS